MTPAQLPPSKAPELVVQMTTTDLRALVAEAVAEGLAAHEPTQPPALLTTDQLCSALQVSRSTLYAMRDRGMPVTYVLDSPRFSLSAVLEWLNDSQQLRAVQESGRENSKSADAGAAVLPLVSTAERKLAQLTPAGRRGR